MTVVIEYIPIREFLFAVDTFFEHIPEFMALYSSLAGDKAINYLQQYPPETAANQPPPPYYQRGTGMVYKDHVLETSDKLGTKWKKEVTKDENSATLTLWNDATNRITNVPYAEHVHGANQASYHAATGWPKLEDVLRALMGARSQRGKEGVEELTKSELAKMDLHLRDQWELHLKLRSDVSDEMLGVLRNIT